MKARATWRFSFDVQICNQKKWFVHICSHKTVCNAHFAWLLLLLRPQICSRHKIKYVLNICILARYGLSSHKTLNHVVLGLLREEGRLTDNGRWWLHRCGLRSLRREIQAGHSWQSCPGAEGWKQMMQSVMRKINVAVARLHGERIRHKRTWVEDATEFDLLLHWPYV